MVRKPYSRFVVIVSLAQASWDRIEGDVAWAGIDPWRLPTLSAWCNLVVQWYRKRMGSKEDQDRLEFTLDQPNPRLRLYALAGTAAKRALTAGTADDHLALMRELEQAKSGG